VQLTGIISNLDENGLFGVIDADDGRLLFFNLLRTVPALREKFRIGTRVHFSVDVSGLSARAVELAPIDAVNYNASSCMPVRRG
jgi:hypothetical protein